MDEFGVLTASYGLKPQGKSAPMAASRRPNHHHNYNNNSATDTSKRDRHHYSSNSGNGGGAFSHDDFGTFRSATTSSNNNHNNPKSQSFGNYGDVFGGFEKNSTMQSDGGAGAASFNYDYMHKNLNDFGLRSSSLPSYNNNNNNSSSSNKNVYGFEDDIFGGMPGLNVSSSIIDDDVFAPIASASKQINGSIDDLLGNIGGSKAKANVVVGNKLNGFDDLIPGFEGRSPPNNGKKSGTKSTSTLLEDPFAMLSTPENATLGVLSDALEKLGQLSTSGRTHVSATNVGMHVSMDPFDVFVNTPSRPEKSESSKTTDDAQTSIPKIPPFKHPVNGAIPVRPPIKPPHVSKRVKSPVVSSIDELEKFATGKVRNTSSPSATPLKDATERFEEKIKLAKERRNTNVSRDKGGLESSKYNSKTSDDGLDPIFIANSRSKSAPRSRTSPNESMVNEPLHSGGGTKVGQLKKVPSAMNIVDDLSSIFEDGVPGEKFEEVQGESEERRRARLGRRCRINDRVAAAVADMNQRDLQSQREQEERHRISETLDGEIKRWAAGKDGNMRALLSSLQLVLWAESGWQAVSLTDIITSTSVKQVYRKATLCLHPDKVQQRGANLEQKYVAEKVFDILKEAWNKFSKEELS